MQDDKQLITEDASGEQTADLSGERLGLPSASDTAAWNCPGKWNLMRECGPKISRYVPDELTESGIRIHKARHLGVPMDLSDDELDIFNKSIAYEDRLVQDWMAAYDIKDCNQVEREERFFLHDPATMQPIASGQLDSFYLAPPYALIVDRKTGFCSNLVPSARNTQLRVQAVLLWREYDNLETIRVAFDKSRFSPKNADWCDYTGTDLQFSHDWILYWLGWTRQPEAPRFPGQHCTHCPVKGFCVEAGSYAMLPSVVAARALASSTDIAAMVGALKPVDLVKLWETKSVIEKILKEVVSRLKGMPTEQLKELGLELGKGRAMNPITKTKECFDFLKGVQMWKEEDLWAALEFSNTALAELAMKDKDLSKDAASKWVRVALAEFITASTAEAPLKRIA